MSEYVSNTRTMLAVLRNVVHDHNATNACTGEHTCWCDDCKAERQQLADDGTLSPFDLPAAVKAKADRTHIAEHAAEKRRADEAEASAAAMRTLLFIAHEDTAERKDQAGVALHVATELRLLNNAGRALLERHASELRQAREERDEWKSRANWAEGCGSGGSERQRLIAERDAAVKRAEALSEENARLKAEDERATEHLREVLRKVDEEQNGLAVCSWCALPTNSDEESKRAHQMTCPKSPIVALYGRAVAHAAEAKRLTANGARHSRVHDELDAILADATATQALDAWRAQQEEREELEAVYQVAKRFDSCDADYEELEKAIAKVKARRGGK